MRDSFCLLKECQVQDWGKEVCGLPVELREEGHRPQDHTLTSWRTYRQLPFSVEKQVYVSDSFSSIVMEEIMSGARRVLSWSSRAGNCKRGRKITWLNVPDPGDKGKHITPRVSIVLDPPGRVSVS